LARALRDRGHEALFALPASDTLERIQDAGFEAFPTRVRSRLPLGAVRALTGIMRERRVTVAHCHSRRAGLAGLPAARLAAVPVKVIHVHSLATAEGSKGLSRLAFRLLNRLADRTVYCSIAARDAVEPGGSARGVVIPNGVHFPAEPRRRPQTPPVIVAVGRLAPAKGYDVLLRALAPVVRDHPGIQVRIAGDGELRPRLLALRGELGLEDTVAFLGFVEELGPLFEQASLLVMPSVWEGLPLALLEAVAAQVPVVATRVGEIPRVLADGRGGYLADPGDPDSLASAILESLRDPVEAERRAARARSEAREVYSLEAMAQAVEELYQGTLRGRG
jgi:glycosyltransferase involved in cell wall biosynthesis